MTKYQLKKKIDELKSDFNDFVDEKTEKLLLSGAIDLNEYDDNFILPKFIFSTICKEAYFQYKPPTKENQAPF